MLKNILFIILGLFLTLSAQAEDQELKYHGQKTESITLQRNVTQTRHRSEEYDSTCNRQIPYNENVCGNETRYRRECTPGQWRNVCEQVPEQQCQDVTRYRQECHDGPSEVQCHDGPSEVQCHDGPSEIQCHEEPGERVCTPGGSRRECHSTPDRQSCHAGPSREVCTDVPDIVCEEQNGRRVCRREGSRQECRQVPGERECDTIPGEEVCRDVQEAPDCNTTPGRRVCENVPGRRICENVPGRRICENVPGQQICRDIAYQDRECSTTYRSECRDQQDEPTCSNIPYQKNVCRDVTRYRTEQYACRETRQVPYDVEIAFTHILNFNFEDFVDDVSKELIFKISSLDEKGEVKVHLPDQKVFKLAVKADKKKTIDEDLRKEIVTNLSIQITSKKVAEDFEKREVKLIKFNEEEIIISGEFIQTLKPKIITSITSLKNAEEVLNIELDDSEWKLSEDAKTLTLPIDEIKEALTRRHIFSPFKIALNVVAVLANGEKLKRILEFKERISLLNSLPLKTAEFFSYERYSINDDNSVSIVNPSVKIGDTLLPISSLSKNMNLCALFGYGENDDRQILTVVNGNQKKSVAQLNVNTQQSKILNGNAITQLVCANQDELSIAPASKRAKEIKLIGATAQIIGPTFLEAIGELPFNMLSNNDGICKLFGFSSVVQGSVKYLAEIRSESSIIDSQGKLKSHYSLLKPGSQRNISQLTCKK